MPLRRVLSLVLISCLAMVSGACGGGKDTLKSANVMLDWTPNPIHSGLLLAKAKGLDHNEGVDVTLRTPASSGDGARLLLAGRTDLAVLDIHDFALLAEQGRPVVAVMEVTGKPLAGLIASPKVPSPKALNGKVVAVTGVPSDAAVTKTIVKGAGGSPNSVKLRNAGYGTIDALLGGHADAAVGFINEEGVAVPAEHPGFHVFKVDSWGAPEYPELLLVTTKQKLAQDPFLVAAVVKAFVKGTREALEKPEAARAAVAAKVGNSGSKLLAQRMAASLAAIAPPSGQPGSFNSGILAEWAKWELANGLVSKLPDTKALFDGRFTD